MFGGLSRWLRGWGDKTHVKKSAKSKAGHRQARRIGLNIEVLETRDLPASLMDVASAITHSFEGQARYVVDNFKQYLGRIPGPAEITGWVNFLNSGVNTSAIESAFVGSSEYINRRGGVGRPWVESLYHDLLNRTPSQAEVDGWYSVLTDGSTPAQVVNGFVTSAERGWHRAAWNYQTYLGRTPSLNEAMGWIGLPAQQNIYQNIQATFVGSYEFLMGWSNSDNREWLVNVYRVVLGRDASSAEVEGWLTATGLGGGFEPDSLRSTMTGWPVSGRSNEGAAIALGSLVTGGTDNQYTYSWKVLKNGQTFATSTSSNLSFAVTDSGSYRVALTATNQAGQKTTAVRWLRVDSVAPTASFSNSGPVGAGQPATVSFAGQADASTVDASAGFVYRYDFDNNGAFEITNTSSASANVPSSLLTSGPHTIRGRIEDKDGAFTDYTTILQVGGNQPIATFGNGGAVNEGSTGTVSFSNQFDSPADMAAGFRYSYDFNNDGAFEITDTTLASATVPASNLTDGPATAIVRGRIKDQGGAFSDYTTGIVINNVTPILTAPPANQTFSQGMAGTVNLGSFTDPAASDGPWAVVVNWGDSTSSSFSLPLRGPISNSHTYSAIGNYTVTVTVTDNDNASNSANAVVSVGQPVTPGEFIVTPFDKIPNFGANPTVVSIANGAWSSSSTWSTGQVPSTGAKVSIAANTTVTYDLLSDAALNAVVVQAGGHLIFRTDISTRLTLVHFLVLEGGELVIGTQSNPVVAAVKAEVVFADQAIDTAKDPEQYGTGLIGLGKVTMHGAVLSQTFIRLAQEAFAGNTTLVLSQPATGWRVGDRLFLPDTRHLLATERFTNYVPKWERPTIQAISPDGLTLTLAAPLQFDHIGARNPTGNLDFLPHAVNLSRNVVIRSASATGTRGHVTFTYLADVDVRYVSFAGLGRTTDAPIDNTTFDTLGQVTHLGANQSERYPVYLDHLIGSFARPVGQYQYTFLGNAITCPLDPMPFIWGLTLNNSHYGLIQENVLFNWAGAGIVGEGGNESYNVFSKNFVGAVRGDENPRDNNGRDGSAFWFRGFNNYLRDNVATNAIGTFWGIVAGSGFNLFWPAASTTSTRIPLLQGVDIAGPGAVQGRDYVLVNMQNVPLLEFVRNETYGATATGFTLWHLGTDGYSSGVAPQTLVKDFRAWHVHEEAFYAYPVHNVLFDGLVVRGHTRALNPFDGGTGWTSGDYWAENITIRNADIQNMWHGFSGATNTPGVIRIENSYFRNYSGNIVIQTLATPGTRATIHPRTTIIDNVRFDPYPGAPDFKAVVMFYFAQPGSNWILRDEVFVYNYNGTTGDNFQVYYSEQRHDFITPQSTFHGPDNDGDGIPDFIDSLGSPVPGLTNQLNWATYGIAFAGAVAPLSATTRAGITGLVKPL